MARYRKKIKWKNLLSTVLAVLLFAGAFIGIVNVSNRDTKSVSALSFKLGAVDETGIFVKSETSIYTKDMFECQGLKIEPDFEATSTYQVFYYGEDKTFLGATDTLKASDGIYEMGDEFAEAKYARIVITPETPVDEDGKLVKDFKIHSYQVAGYANDYTITVNKNQTFGATTDVES